MKQAELLDNVVALYAEEIARDARNFRSTVVRNNCLLQCLPGDMEAGDIVIVPPSLVTVDTPSRGYIQGCIEKCWQQIRGRHLCTADLKR